MSELHRCGFGPMCRGFILEGGKRAPARIDVPHGLCAACLRYAVRSLRALPADWCRLKLTIGELRAQAGGGGRRPKPGSRVPLNAATDGLMREIVAVSRWAVDVVADELRVDRVAARRNASSAVEYRLIVRAVELVSPNIERLIGLPDGVEICERFVLLHRRATRQLGETEQRERLHLPCPSCGRMSLVREVQDRRRTTSGDGGVGTAFCVFTFPQWKYRRPCVWRRVGWHQLFLAEQRVQLCRQLQSMVAMVCL